LDPAHDVIREGCRWHRIVSARRTGWQRALIRLVVLACVATLVLWAAGQVAYWLVVVDPLQPGRSHPRPV